MCLPLQMRLRPSVADVSTSEHHRTVEAAPTLHLCVLPKFPSPNHHVPREPTH
jgi:hypothetical protein